MRAGFFTGGEARRQRTGWQERISRRAKKEETSQRKEGRKEGKGGRPKNGEGEENEGSVKEGAESGGKNLGDVAGGRKTEELRKAV